MVGVFALLITGCYTLEPMVTAQPATGSKVALSINDAGRVALGGQMGPAVLRVHGRLVSHDTEEYDLAVTGVDLLAGGFQTWQGERVRISDDHVSALLERRFSKAKTIALGAAAIGAVALVGRGAFLPGFLDPEPTPDDSTFTRRGRMPGLLVVPLSLRSLTPPRSF